MVSNPTEETLLGSLNARSIATGSKATSGTAAYLGSATTYTGGIVLTNGDDTIVMWIRVGGAAVVDGDTSTMLPPYASLPLAWGDLATISVIAESGTPRIGWVGNTLR
jgi:hypothetical protein